MRAEAAALLAAHQVSDEQGRMLLIYTLVSDRGDGAKVLALLTLLDLPVQKVLSLLALAKGGAVPLSVLTKPPTSLQEGKKNPLHC